MVRMVQTAAVVLAMTTYRGIINSIIDHDAVWQCPENTPPMFAAAAIFLNLICRGTPLRRPRAP